jgi:hypothetical protein
VNVPENAVWLLARWRSRRTNARFLEHHRAASGKPVTKFSTVVVIKASPAKIVTMLFDVERWPEWTSTMTSVQQLDQGPLAVGSKARIRQPQLLPAVWQVTELDLGRGFSWVTRRLGLQLEAVHLVEVDGTGSRVTISIGVSGLLGLLAARFHGNLLQRYIATEAEGLRKHCED